jgi:hypothetical protein
MLRAADYIYEVTANGQPHSVNTPRDSLNNKLIVDRVKESYQASRKLEFAEDVWTS